MPLLLLFSATLLTGCAGTEVPERGVTKIEMAVPEVPTALRHCKAKPPVPGSKAKPPSSKQTARWIVQLDDAYDDCADKLGTVDHILTQQSNTLNGLPKR